MANQPIPCTGCFAGRVPVHRVDSDGVRIEGSGLEFTLCTLCGGTEILKGVYESLNEVYKE